MQPASPSSPAHTAGPWTISDDGCYVEAGTELGTVTIARTDYVTVGTCREANARLIAAAPDLLEYCKMLLEDCEAMAKDHSIGGDWDWSVTERNLKELIAKAECVSDRLAFDRGQRLFQKHKHD